MEAMLLIDATGRVHQTEKDSWKVYFLGCDGEEAIEHYLTGTEASNQPLEASSEPASWIDFTAPFTEMKSRLLASFSDARVILNNHGPRAGIGLDVSIRGRKQPFIYEDNWALRRPTIERYFVEYYPPSTYIVEYDTHADNHVEATGSRLIRTGKVEREASLTPSKERNRLSLFDWVNISHCISRQLTKMYHKAPYRPQVGVRSARNLSSREPLSSSLRYQEIKGKGQTVNPLKYNRACSVLVN